MDHPPPPWRVYFARNFPLLQVHKVLYQVWLTPHTHHILCGGICVINMWLLSLSCQSNRTNVFIEPNQTVTNISWMWPVWTWSTSFMLIKLFWLRLIIFIILDSSVFRFTFLSIAAEITGLSSVAVCFHILWSLGPH